MRQGETAERSDNYLYLVVEDCLAAFDKFVSVIEVTQVKM